MDNISKQDSISVMEKADVMILSRFKCYDKKSSNISSSYDGNFLNIVIEIGFKDKTKITSVGCYSNLELSSIQPVNTSTYEFIALFMINKMFVKFLDKESEYEKYLNAKELDRILSNKYLTEQRTKI